MARNVELLTADANQEVLHPRTVSNMVIHGNTTVEVELNNKLEKTEKAVDSALLNGVTEDTQPNPDTIVKRDNDGAIKVFRTVSYQLMSDRLNLLIGGNFTDGTYTGDVVFRTNMRPDNNGVQNIGGTNFRFGECWVTTGAFNTSDERCKTNIETFDIEDCFEMIKNTDVKSYTLLSDDKTKMSDEELMTLSLENKEKSTMRQLGIIAQDIVDYKCSDYILVQENPDDLYAINPYNLTSAVMGALKSEIEKREKLEKEFLEFKELVLKQNKSMA